MLAPLEDKGIRPRQTSPGLAKAIEGLSERFIDGVPILALDSNMSRAFYSSKSESLSSRERLDSSTRRERPTPSSGPTTPIASNCSISWAARE
jgi:hypothetical protein